MIGVIMKVDKRYICLIDTESTQPCEANGNQSHVFDFAYMVFEKNAPFTVVEQQGFILSDYCKEPLFNHSNKDFFNSKNLYARTEKYRQFLRDGKMERPSLIMKPYTRELISVAGLNGLLMQIACKYKPTLMAYNLAFDRSLCLQSGIAVSKLFQDQKCLMSHAIQVFMRRKGFIRYCLKNGLVSPKNFLQYKAETIGGYLNIQGHEPHCALEDLIFWEFEIYKVIARQKKRLNDNYQLNWHSISLANVYNFLHG